MAAIPCKRPWQPCCARAGCTAAISSNQKNLRTPHNPHPYTHASAAGQTPSPVRCRTGHPTGVCCMPVKPATQLLRLGHAHLAATQRPAPKCSSRQSVADWKPSSQQPSSNPLSRAMNTTTALNLCGAHQFASCLLIPTTLDACLHRSTYAASPTSPYTGPTQPAYCPSKQTRCAAASHITQGQTHLPPEKCAPLASQPSKHDIRRVHCTSVCILMSKHGPLTPLACAAGTGTEHQVHSRPATPITPP